MEELYYVANNQKVADKKKADNQEALEKSHADSAEWSCDSYMKDLEKIVHEAAKVIWRIRKTVLLALQYEAAKFTRKTWRIGEESLKWNWLGYILRKRKKTAAVIGVGTMGAAWATVPTTMY